MTLWPLDCGSGWLTLRIYDSIAQGGPRHAMGTPGCGSLSLAARTVSCSPLGARFQSLS